MVLIVNISAMCGPRSINWPLHYFTIYILGHSRLSDPFLALNIGNEGARELNIGRYVDNDYFFKKAELSENFFFLV